MTSLNKPDVKTDKISGWQLHHIHVATMYILDEYFLSSYYAQCIRYAESKGEKLAADLEMLSDDVKASFDYKTALAQGKDLSAWAIEMRSQNYHKMHTHAFVGMWGAFEAGIEDTICSFIENDRQVAQTCISKFKAGRYDITQWPWATEKSLEIAQKLDLKAKEATPNGGQNMYARLQTLFSWFEIDLPDNPQVAANLAEASRIRNIILHRNGQVSVKDTAGQP